jgi:hypothetical protein
VVFGACGNQLAPASVVARTVPFVPGPLALPATQQLRRSAHATSLRLTMVPEVRADHVAPPSTVWTMVPAAPTATQLLASTHAMALSALSVFDVCGAHVAPPLTVLRMKAIVPEPFVCPTA